MAFLSRGRFSFAKRRTVSMPSAHPFAANTYRAGPSVGRNSPSRTSSVWKGKGRPLHGVRVVHVPGQPVLPVILERRLLDAVKGVERAERIFRSVDAADTVLYAGFAASEPSTSGRRSILSESSSLSMGIPFACTSHAGGSGAKSSQATSSGDASKPFRRDPVLTMDLRLCRPWGHRAHGKRMNVTVCLFIQRKFDCTKEGTW